MTEALRAAFAPLNLPLLEDHRYDARSGTHTHALCLGGELAALNLCVAGKGPSEARARIGAWGELAERVQCGMFIGPPNRAMQRIIAARASAGLTASRPFEYAPDEASGRILGDGFTRLLAAGLDVNEARCRRLVSEFLGAGAPYVRHISVRTGATVWVPPQLADRLASATGHAAGDTRQQALLHALCEIAERFAIQEAFRAKRPLPSVGWATFGDAPVLGRLASVRASCGLRFDIKDLSLGRGLPVVGLAATAADGRCRFLAAADPDPVLALEKAVSELFQGSADWLNGALDAEERGPARLARVRLDQQLIRCLSNEPCRYPPALFAQQPVGELAWGRTRMDTEDDVARLVATLLPIAGDIYVRDVSFLGVPCFRVFAPAMTTFARVFFRARARVEARAIASLPALWSSNAEPAVVDRARNALLDLSLAPHHRRFDLRHWSGIEQLGRHASWTGAVLAGMAEATGRQADRAWLAHRYSIDDETRTTTEPQRLPSYLDPGWTDPGHSQAEAVLHRLDAAAVRGQPTQTTTSKLLARLR